MANIIPSECPRCHGLLVAHVCYDECAACGYVSSQAGCLRFKQLQDGDQFQAGFDLVSNADLFVKGSPPGWLPLPFEVVEPNAYTDNGRWVAFGPEAPVRKISKGG